MEEIDLKELIAMFMKRKLLIILVVIIFALIGAIYTVKFITPTYQSTTRLLLVQTGEKSSNVFENTGSITTADITLNSKLINNYRDISKSEAVLSKVIQNLNLDITYQELKAMTSVTVATDTEILQLTVEYTDPEIACNIAKEIANVFIETVNYFYKLDNLNVLDEAKVNTTPSNVHLAKNIVIFAFVGGILVSGYILLINMLDTTVKSDTDIERALDVPVLASIVLTNENAKKNVQKQADNLYKMSGFDSNDVQITETAADSVFENYSDEESNMVEENEIQDAEEDDAPYVNKDFNNRSRKNKRNKGRNRRNG